MKQSDPKIIFIHGNGGGSAQDDWFVYAKHELEKLGIKAIVRDFPDPVYARERYWLPFLKDELKTDENTILIGHSSGAIAAMRYAEKNRILGSVLVGVYYTDLNNERERKSGYFNRPWRWKRIKANQKWAVVFASTDDPWIDIKEPRYLARAIGAEYHEYTDQGHFGGNKPYKKFPELIQVIRRRLNK